MSAPGAEHSQTPFRGVKAAADGEPRHAEPCLATITNPFQGRRRGDGFAWDGSDRTVDPFGVLGLGALVPGVLAGPRNPRLLTVEAFGLTFEAFGLTVEAFGLERG